MAAHKQGLEVANTELAKLSRTDRLTPLSNRGHWEEKLIAEFTRFKRYAVECTLVMFDIDHIKKVNDSFGHQAGDEVLRTMAQLLRKMVRTTDIVGRYGGEEFGVILASTGVEGGNISPTAYVRKWKSQLSVMRLMRCALRLALASQRPRRE